MSGVTVGPELIGRKVRNAARPEWGLGTVLRVEATRVNGVDAHRVLIQFDKVGSRPLIVPPARLLPPAAEPQRAEGWLESLGKSTLDDRLRQLPEAVLEVLGSLPQRLLAAVPLYRYTEEPASLLRWACDQSGAADPLSLWTRDELLSAFGDFCVERDSHFRNLAAQLQISEGPDALRQTLEAFPETTKDAIRAALERVI